MRSRLCAAEEAAKRADCRAEACATDLVAAHAASARTEYIPFAPESRASETNLDQVTQSFNHDLQNSISQFSTNEHARMCTQIGEMQEHIQQLKGEVDLAQVQRNTAEAACKELEHKLEVSIRSHEEDAHTYHALHNAAGDRSVASSISPHLTSLTTANQPESLLQELEDVAYDSALQRAMDAERALREELQEAYDKLENMKESDAHTHEQEDTAAAAEAASVQERVSEMHGGTWFGKVAFRRQLKQQRFVRLTFDLKRIEWAQNERGPFKALCVNAILRVDFGDVSRTFRCYEFGRANRPNPARCLSISTPSRSLDLIAASERDVETWVLGLNEVIPYRLERQRVTVQDFWLRRALLRLEHGDGNAQIDHEIESVSTTSNPSRADSISTTTTSTPGRRQISRFLPSGSMFRGR